MSGLDTIGIAETGSGKTLAYCLPLFRHILDQRPLVQGEGPIGLVLAPTRELTFQIYNEAKTFCKQLGLRCSYVYGGAGLSSQLAELKRGSHIVVCTPGRMLDVLSLNNGKFLSLGRVTYVVIDEADRMFDLGFEPQLSKILACVRPDRQTLMFSATFPKAVERLAKALLRRPVEIVVGARNATCLSVEQFVEVLREEEKFTRLLQILQDWYVRGKILVFVEQKNEADELFKYTMKEGYECRVLHGGHDQADRDHTVAEFRAGSKCILIATSIAARGLDVKNLNLVVNYMCPCHMEDYIHRVGRTGRAGNRGTAITFITKEEMKYSWELVKLLRNSDQQVPDDLIELSLEYKQRVEQGDAKPYRFSGYGGKGFKFNTAEHEQRRATRQKLKKNAFSDSDTDSSDQEFLRTHKNRHEMTVADHLKDPKVKAAALSAAQIAAKAAILSGNKHNALRAAKEAVELVTLQMQQGPSVEESMETVLKIRDEFISQSSEAASIELDINDYPLSARTRVMSRDYLNTLSDLTGCKATVRGSYVDPSRRSGIGQSRLHLHISGPSRLHCVNARNEVKRFLEDTSSSLAKTKP